MELERLEVEQKKTEQDRDQFKRALMEKERENEELRREMAALKIKYEADGNS